MVGSWRARLAWTVGLEGGLMDNSREMAATIVGSVIGAVVVYFFFTERGRNGRRQIEEALEDFSREVLSFSNAVQRAAGVATDTWKLLNDTFAEGGKPPARYPSSQRSPF
jgi:pilus assembly protein TadC